MSDRAQRDRGVTLPELLVTVVMIGLVVAVIAAAVTVVLRNERATGGRLNIARGEQSVGTWLPADLAAVNMAARLMADPAASEDRYGLVTGFDPVDQQTGAAPCGVGWSCPAGLTLGGRNELMLTWRSLVAGPAVQQTRVSYRFVQVGAEYQLVRVACAGPVGGAPTCQSVPVLHDLPSTWTMTATDELVFGPGDPAFVNTAGAQVVVTIDGGQGPGVGGSAGGTDTVTVTAGGVTMGTIDAINPAGAPSFVREASRCGGHISLIVDNSNSIGSQMSTVRTAVQGFIESFRGTPVQLQVVRLGSTARVIGDGGPKNDGYYDMSENADVDGLKAEINTSNFPTDSGSNGGTNWESAWWRALTSSGFPVTIKPETVVFFTDGEPTYYGTSSASGGDGGSFTKTGFDRTNAIVAPFRQQTPPSVIGVGVDASYDGRRTLTTRDLLWINNPGSSNDVYKTGQEVLAYLVDGDDFTATPYTGSNAETANLYLLDGFSGLTAALRTVALKDCAGTLTVRTRLDDGTTNGQKLATEVVYENQPGGPDTLVRTVATSSRFPTGTFDFDIPSGSANVQVRPQVSSDLTAYRLSPTKRWECRAGGTNLTETYLTLESGPAFSGVQVPVGANQAVSCTMWVVPA